MRIAPLSIDDADGVGGACRAVCDGVCSAGGCCGDVRAGTLPAVVSAMTTSARTVRETMQESIFAIYLAVGAKVLAFQMFVWIFQCPPTFFHTFRYFPRSVAGGRPYVST